ncbi:flagellar basal body rod protein FlgC [Planktotalea sp.]|jgi:flagellar basal-body rod protein FlgC|uniref:flagellar basal body rod protein FlgC n=1 Tax=Planktotalea sp. TaxID=2029877 RepID=UPI003F6C9224
MNDFSSALSIASSGLKAQSARLRHVSENIANADTPGYHRKIVSFDLSRDTGEVTLGRLSLDQSQLREIYDPSHPLADAKGNYDSSNVDLIIEIADAREAQRSYEANLKMLDQTRQMSSSLIELLRR